MSAIGGPNIVEDGLVLALDAANVKSYPGSGTTVSDLSGNSYTGAFVGGTTFSENPKSFNTNATVVTDGNYISVSPTISFADTSEYSFEYFIKLRASAQVNWHSLAGQNATNPWLSVFTTNTIGNSWYIRYRQSGGTYIDGSTQFYNIQQNWVHLGICVDSSRNLNIHINGTYIETINPTNTFFNINRVAGGYLSGANHYALQGSMAFCRIYNRALTPTEVLQNYNATKGRFGL